MKLTFVLGKGRQKNQETQRFMEEENPWKLEGSDFFMQEKEEYIQALSKYELLIIDDFGMERNTEYALENIFSVIDRRCCSERPLIITTNLSLTSMKQESDLLKKRIYDRVLQMCVPVKVDGESRRKKIASENLQIMKTIIQNQ